MKNEIMIAQPCHYPTRQIPDSDETVLKLFLHGRCANTRSAYERDIGHFRTSVGKHMRSVSLGDLQAYADTLASAELRESSRHRKLSAVRSLFRFAHVLGFTPFDVSRPLRLPKFQNRLSERILSEGDVQRMIGLEENERNRSILIALYGLGCRVSELCGLSVRDCHPRGDGTGNVTLFGKGGKTNVLFVPPPVWSVIEPLLAGRNSDDAVFRSRRHTRLRRETVSRLVGVAARRARIEKSVSAHFMRHAHCSHAIDRGSPLSLVMAQCAHSSAAVTSRYIHARPGDSSARYLPL